MHTPDTTHTPLRNSTQPLGEFVAQLTRLVIDEAEATREQVQRIWALPLEERVARGRAIADVQIMSVAPGGVLTLHCHRNEARFREGDVLGLHRGDPFAEPKYMVTLEYDDETELLVSSDDTGLQQLQASDGWFLDEGYLDLRDMALDALAQAADTAAGRERILPLLAGAVRPQGDPERYQRAFAQAEAWG